MKAALLIVIRLVGRIWCRFQGVKTGKRNLIHGLPSIRNKGGEIILAEDVTINSAGWANPLNDGRRTVLYVANGAKIAFGAGSGISSSRLICSRGISIGRGSLIGAGCLICDSDMHEIPLGSRNPVRAEAIHIGDDVFIGAGCTILKGAVIGDGVVIGAGAVVTGHIPPRCLAAGNPAKPVRNFL